ncbi:MAG TPA: tetratricopeptide repeat protein [Thiopseudomonas sp.]|nr:tetratricopeptide repeat protein [Thiopseudomonas sp.]
MAALALSWPEWIRPYWLLSAPLAVLLLIMLYRASQKQQSWRTLLPKSFQNVLLAHNTQRPSTTSYWLLALTWLCTVIALLGPTWQTNTEQPSQHPQLAPLVIAIQLTPELLATDLAPNRLSHVRKKVLDILELREDAVSALVVYAGSAHTLVPLSNDRLTSTNLLQALHPKLMPKPGQRADLAVQQAIDLLQQGAQGTGQILLISTGVSPAEQNAIIGFIDKHPIALKLMGVGTAAGAPIIESEQGHLRTDSSGAIVLSRLDQVSLQLLAEHTASPYSPLTANQTDIQALELLTPINQQWSSSNTPEQLQGSDLGYWFILPALLLTVVLARRGSFLIVLLLLASPSPSYAFQWEDLWLRADQRGAKLIEHQPAQAAELFIDPLWRASALYLAADYQAAARLFAEFDTAEAHYNRGNALALAGMLSDALAAYQHALLLDPKLLSAQYNQQLIKDQLAAEQSKNQPDEPVTDTPAEPALPASQTAHTLASESLPAAPQQSDSKQPSTATQPAMPGSPQSNNDVNPTTPQQVSHEPDKVEQKVHLESWLEQIPDNPSELLRRKFLYEHNLQEVTP